MEELQGDRWRQADSCAQGLLGWVPHPTGSQRQLHAGSPHTARGRYTQDAAAKRDARAGLHGQSGRRARVRPRCELLQVDRARLGYLREAADQESRLK